MANNGMVPTIVNHYNVYNNTDKIIGKGEEMPLPSIEAVMTTIQSALGEVEMPVMGKIQKMEQEIDFVTLSKEAFKMYTVGENAMVTIRAAQQGRTNDGELSAQSLKVVIKGPCKKFELGKIKNGEGTSAKLTIGVNNMSIDIDGDNVLELDVFNGVFKVNGVDKMASILALC